MNGTQPDDIVSTAIKFFVGQVDEQIARQRMPIVDFEIGGQQAAAERLAPSEDARRHRLISVILIAQKPGNALFRDDFDRRIVRAYQPGAGDVIDMAVRINELYDRLRREIGDRLHDLRGT
jgi:hypothetical protein